MAKGDRRNRTYGPIGSVHENVTPIMNPTADLYLPTDFSGEATPVAPAIPDAWRQQPPPGPQFEPGENIWTSDQTLEPLAVPVNPLRGIELRAPALGTTQQEITAAQGISGAAAGAAWQDTFKYDWTEYQGGGPYGTRTDPMYGAPLDPAFPDVDIAGMVSDYARMYYEYAYGQIDEEFDIQLARLNEDYGAEIAALQEIMDDYKQGRIDAGTAYDEYQKRSAAILQAAITEPIDPIETAVEEALVAEYAAAGGELGQVAALIDAGGDPSRFGQALGEINTFKSVMIEGLRNNILSIEEIHHATTEVAHALAVHAYADDQYKSEYAQEEIDIQIKSAIDAQAKRIEEAQAAWELAKKRMAEDRDRAKNDIPDYVLDEDFFYNGALTEWAHAMGFDADEIAVISAKGLEAWEAAAGNMADYTREITALINDYNMGIVGVDWVQLIGMARGNPVLEQQMQDLYMSGDLYDQRINFIDLADQAFRWQLQQNDMVEPFPGFSDLHLATLTNLASILDMPEAWTADTPIVDALRNYGTFRKDFEEEWKAEQEAAAARERAKYHGSGQAPDNYGNRYEPDYVYRRETAAYWIADQFNAEFGYSGKTNIGGLGYMRPPDRGAANSDHQSGGALDLYGKDEAERIRIAAWARSQPWASMVIYEGDSAHEGHHVHVSIRIGWRVP